MKTMVNAFLFILLSNMVGIGVYTAKAQDSTSTNVPSKDSTIVKANIKTSSFQGSEENYYVIQHRNQFFDRSEMSVNRETPQASLENFILSARNADYLKAAHSFNLNLISDDVSNEQIEQLAQKLYIIINKNVSIDWDKLSERPDGQVDKIFAKNKAVAGEPRKSIAFGKLNLKERDVTLRLQRVKYKTEPPYWVISANTVEHIDALYAAYGPTKMVQLVPDGWGLKGEFLKIPIWKIVGLFISMGIAYGLGWITMLILKRIFGRSKWEWISSFSSRLAIPAAYFVGMLALYLLLNNLIVFSGDFANWFYTMLLIATVVCGTWFIMRILNAFIFYMAENRTDDIYAEENLESRQVLTQLSVARRVVSFIIFLTGTGIILSQFESFKNLGTTLFASAGVATIIIGIAAQGTLGNIIAGIQIAITKPAQIGDLVLFDGQWGHVEDIGFVFMIVKTWDERRIVTPLKSVISNSFENWSMRGSKQIRSIDIYTDYRINIQKVREKYEELLKESPTWDKQISPSVQVVESTEKAIKIRALCSAKDPFTAWNLQCELREKLIAYICELEEGLGLPKDRIALESRDEPDQ
ncbi:mechanosensitive ion channel [Subsaximicrobium wynnwilliamsii]|uniref:Mechanosensitive ion channel n=1 Tax=Subsaximicrobium wynnwilliamsii TaxID=291179 RepID=A0A5C6ZMV5_9FLAO|nr:mechanosensitive ion channel [Subsaximicrobium wynnwilliamsii]TXD90968.1 mechanosensitive ion channel [Subsaximicrobium wynnwilliamsii]TXE05477.1 mechanosensitive ion channel [Subsaximicrobium wynnwilliamsii]